MAEMPQLPVFAGTLLQKWRDGITHGTITIRQTRD
jgi:hypothetical protein